MTAQNSFLRKKIGFGFLNQNQGHTLTVMIFQVEPVLNDLFIAIPIIEIPVFLILIKPPKKEKNNSLRIALGGTSI